MEMKLGLSLGDSSATNPSVFFSKNINIQEINDKSTSDSAATGLGFCMALENINPAADDNQEIAEKRKRSDENDRNSDQEDAKEGVLVFDHLRRVSPPPQLDLLPLVPVMGFPLFSNHGSSEEGSSGKTGRRAGEHPLTLDEVSSPISATTSSFQIDLSLFMTGRGGNLDGRIIKRESEVLGNESVERASSRGSDEDENGLNTRKKLRLSKEQSAFLEGSFTEHSTLNPKQKLAIAKQLNLRPRQVEVWFQNRRARTKLKQTEAESEYLRRCCEALKEENKKLNKELQELRALKASIPYHMQLPATTLTMCPSCERISPATTAVANDGATTSTDHSIIKNKPFSIV